MTRRQPSFTETKRTMERIERILSEAKDISFCHGYDWLESRHGDGISYRWPRCRMEFIAYPCSDVSRTCRDCGTILIDRYRGIAAHQQRCTCREWHYKRKWRPGIDCDCPTGDEWGDGCCLSCANKRNAKIRMNDQWNETRLLIGRVEREIYEQRKNSRTTSGLPVVSNGGSEGRQANC